MTTLPQKNMWEFRTFNAEDTNLNYALRYSKRMKRRKMKMTVSSSGLRIIVGNGVKTPLIESFIQKNKGWIDRHLQTLKSKSERQILGLPDIFEHGSEIAYRGQLYPIYIIPTTLPDPNVHFTGTSFEIGLVNSVEIGSWIKEWMMNRIKLDIETIIQNYGQKLGAYPKNYRIKHQKTLWGSCSRRGNININFNLIFAPYEVLEYVVVHEMCHLKHPNHSNNFWNEVAVLLPDYKTPHQWLKENNYIINIGK
jgi:predicted metal-dependent hydrolase